MELKELKDSFLDNKIASAALILIFAMVLGISSSLVQNIGVQSNSAFYDAGGAERLTSSGFFPGPGQDPSSGSYVEVKEANIKIKSEGIETDISRLERVSSSFSGFIESSSKNNGELYTSADLTVRVPKENFSGFIDTVRSEFGVESYSVRDYRISTERETSELEILNSTMGEYEQIKQRIKAREDSSEKLDLLMQVTEKQLELKEKQRRYENDLSSKQTKSDLGTVSINLQEQRKIDVVPDNLGIEFKNEVRQTLDNVANTVITTFTDGVEWLFKGFKLLFILAALAVPTLVGLRIGRWIYDQYV